MPESSGPIDWQSQHMTTKMLELRKVSSYTRIPDATLQTLELKQVEDMLMRDLIFSLEGHIFAEKTGHEEVTKHFSRSVPVPLRSRFYPVVYSEAAAVMLSVIFFVLGVLPVSFMLGAWSIFVATAAICYFMIPKEVEATVSGDVTVEAQYWNHYPEATLAQPPPKYLGRPYPHVEYRSELRVDGDDDAQV